MGRGGELRVSTRWKRAKQNRVIQITARDSRQYMPYVLSNGLLACTTHPYTQITSYFTLPTHTLPATDANTRRTKNSGTPIDDRCPAGITELRAGNDRVYCNSAILLCSRLISDPSAVGSTSWLLRVVTRWGLTPSLLCVPSQLAVNLEQIFACLQEIPILRDGDYF